MMKDTRLIIKKILRNKCCFEIDDIYNYIHDFIFDDYNDSYLTLHYEVRCKGDVYPCNFKIIWQQFIEGFMKCILHKKYKLLEDNIIPYLRNDINYFKNEVFYKTKLERFQARRPLDYLYYYQHISEYIESYTTRLSLENNSKMFVIYYYNKDNSLNRVLNRI